MKKLAKRELSELKHFNTFADKYDYNYHYSKPFTQYKIKKKSNEFVRIVKKHFGMNKLDVLEIGSGTGEYTKNIAEKIPHSKIIGLDISPLILKIAKGKCKNYKNVTFKMSSAYKTDFVNRKFDVVYGFYVLHHLDLETISKEIARITKPGGLIFFYEPNILNPIVYLIKNSGYLKKAIGDSPDEYAINPLSIAKEFGNEFSIKSIVQTEFVWPLLFLPTRLMIFLDKLFSFFQYIPIFNMLGGSVQVCLIKKK